MLNWQNYMYYTKNTNRVNLFFIKYKFLYFIIR